MLSQGLQLCCGCGGGSSESFGFPSNEGVSCGGRGFAAQTLKVAASRVAVMAIELKCIVVRFVMGSLDLVFVGDE